MRGLLAVGWLRVPLDPEWRRVVVGVVEPLAMPAESIVALLDGPARAWPSGVRSNVEELREGLHLWLLTHQRGACAVWGGSGQPDLFGLPERMFARGTVCVLDGTSLVTLAWSDEAHRAGELLILTPPGSEALAERVADTIIAWAARGRPRDADLTIRAYRRAAHEPPLRPDTVKITQRWTTFELAVVPPLAAGDFDRVAALFQLGFEAVAEIALNFKCVAAQRAPRPARPLQLTGQLLERLRRPAQAGNEGHGLAAAALAIAQ
jgi:hypothetical protein